MPSGSFVSHLSFCIWSPSVCGFLTFVVSFLTFVLSFLTSVIKGGSRQEVRQRMRHISEFLVIKLKVCYVTYTLRHLETVCTNSVKSTLFYFSVCLSIFVFIYVQTSFLLRFSLWDVTFKTVSPTILLVVLLQ